MGITITQIEAAVRNNSKREIEEREIVVGLTLKGEPFPALLSSWLIGGQTQQGKSVIAAWFVLWFVLAGAQIVLLDPHKHNKKRGLFAKLEPLQAWFAREPIDCLDVDELLSCLDWLEEEYRQRRRSMEGIQPLLVVMDEFNELISSGLSKKQAAHLAEVIGNLARGGAKHGLFVIAIGHNFDLASAGGNAVRRNIIGRVSAACEIGEMCNILDTTDRTRLRKLASLPPLRPGQAIVKVPGFGLYRLRYPLITSEYLAAMATFMRKIDTASTLSDSEFIEVASKSADFSSEISDSEFLTPSTPALEPIEPSVTFNPSPKQAMPDTLNSVLKTLNSASKNLKITEEELRRIIAEGNRQIAETGRVQRGKIVAAMQGNTHTSRKVKAVCDFLGWHIHMNQDKLDPAVWEEIKTKHNHRCVRCGCYDENLEPDRIIPAIKGGYYTSENVQPLCKSCNSSKGAKVVDYR